MSSKYLGNLLGPLFLSLSLNLYNKCPEKEKKNDISQQLSLRRWTDIRVICLLVKHILSPCRAGIQSSFPLSLKGRKTFYILSKGHLLLMELPVFTLPCPY